MDLVVSIVELFCFTCYSITLHHRLFLNKGVIGLMKLYVILLSNVILSRTLLYQAQQGCDADPIVQLG